LSASISKKKDIATEQVQSTSKPFSRKEITMTTMTNSNRNGRKRMSLDEQIGRLDQTLDGLADGLNEAVADAVKMAVGNAVREAVQCTLTDVLTNPDILARLRATAAPKVEEEPARPEVSEPEKHVSIWYRLGCLCKRIRDSLADVRKTLRSSAGNLRGWTSERLTALWEICQMLSPFKNHLMTALAIGMLVGIGVWFAGPWLGIVASAVGGFVMTLGVQAGLWVRKLLAHDQEEMA
jgi:hypothetical protein